jgi:hypothetical protein
MTRPWTATIGKKLQLQYYDGQQQLEDNAEHSTFYFNTAEFMLHYIWQIIGYYFNNYDF